jgi:type VI secretion system protein ImpI
MGLTLTIENETSLPDGGPLSVTVSGKRGIDIGRDQHLDWTLPDPSRAISGKHCEVRYVDGAYVLYDVSTNGTYLDGQDGRLKGPHRLRTGDRLVIGHYIIAVRVDGESSAAEQRVQQPVAYPDLWNPSDDAAPPVDASQIRAPAERPAALRPDFLDWAADVPDLADRQGGPSQRGAPPADDTWGAPPPTPRAPAPDDDASWARGATPPAPVPEPPPPMPSPRRPRWVAREPEAPWAAPDAAGEPAEAAAPEEPVKLPPLSDFEPEPRPEMVLVGDFAQYVARGAGLPAETLARQSPEQLAEQLGVLMRLVTENVRQLLNARLQAKRLSRSTSQTMIQAIDNNPLKFAPTTEEALRIMFGPATSSYLDGRRAFEQSFDDLKKHQIRTFAAMQQALAMLVEDLDPQAIDHDTGVDKGIAALVTSRKAKLWDTYVARWQKKKRRYEGGLVEVFMDYFAECYDRGNEIR